MLKNLHIQNYAIIDEISIDFSSQLNIITGETGAGKSILMGALSLILGERADSAALTDSSRKCFVEGVFAVEDKAAVKDFLLTNELDNGSELLLRREIASTGKSRAFINDTPVTLQQIKQLASLLVDLHQQFDTLELGDSDFQREVIDALADNAAHLSNYKAVYLQWKKAQQDLKALQTQQASFQKELDYHQFLFDELNELSLKENELEDLEAELKILSNSEGIKAALGKVYFELKESETPMVQLLKQLYNQLQPFAAYHPSLETIIQRIQSTQIELQDIANEVESINDTVLYDENRINIINDKLSLGYKLLKKHNVQTTNELLQIQADIEQKLQAVLHIDDAIKNKEKEAAQYFSQATQIADIISKNRHQQTKPLAEKVNKLLHQVGMPNAQLKVEINDAALTDYGKDDIEFLFDANKSNKFEPIRKVASGGELSRLMLCIKSLVAQKMDLPTLIFDEIDTGISGEAAKQVGIIMQQLASSRQIICITHQPQIAAKANKHLFVYKQNDSNKIKTNIKTLDTTERTIAIAKMLSGENPSEAALASAKEMMVVI
ncbi:MAG: DNA repair protein RecN [Chitinophagaceae bacterium]